MQEGQLLYMEFLSGLCVYEATSRKPRILEMIETWGIYQGHCVEPAYERGHVLQATEMKARMDAQAHWSPDNAPKNL